MTKSTGLQMGAVVFLVLGIAIGYAASQTGVDLTDSASAQTAAADSAGTIPM